jgi:hypothetical protein
MRRKEDDEREIELVRMIIKAEEANKKVVRQNRVAQSQGEAWTIKDKESDNKIIIREIQRYIPEEDIERLTVQLDASIEELKQLQEYGKRLEGETRKKREKNV